MADYVDPLGEDEYDVCPYNPSHKLKKCRMPYHLVKCSKSYDYVTLVKCPYNATHRVAENSYQEHLEQCPQRMLLMRDADVEVTSEHLQRCLEPVQIVDDSERVEDDWDDTIDFSQVTRNLSNELKTKINFGTPTNVTETGETSETSSKRNASGMGRGKAFSSIISNGFRPQPLGRGIVFRRSHEN